MSIIAGRKCGPSLLLVTHVCCPGKGSPFLPCGTFNMLVASGRVILVPKEKRVCEMPGGRACYSVTGHAQEGPAFFLVYSSCGGPRLSSFVSLRPQPLSVLLKDSSLTALSGSSLCSLLWSPLLLPCFPLAYPPSPLLCFLCPLTPTCRRFRPGLWL